MYRMNDTIEVVIGLVFNSKREVLLAWRGPEKTPGNCWEFPGGKVEPGESRFQAICRELKEEINILVQRAENFDPIYYQYEDNMVVLYPWLIEEYSGDLFGAEGQQIIWTKIEQLKDMVLPPANYDVVELLHKVNFSFS